MRRLVRLQFPAHAAAVAAVAARGAWGLSALGGTPPQRTEPQTDHTYSSPSVHPPPKLPRLPRPPSAPSRDAVAAVEDRDCRVSTGEGGGKQETGGCSERRCFLDCAGGRLCMQHALARSERDVVPRGAWGTLGSAVGGFVGAWLGGVAH